MANRTSGRQTAETQQIGVGSLQLIFDPASGFIRHIRNNGTEVLRGVYAAVRDQYWNTVPATISALQVSQTDGQSDIDFVAHCRSEAIDFRWEGRIRIEAAGTIVYSFLGRANSTFLRNRIGFCVLHSPECAGKPCHIRTVDGLDREAVFPIAVSPHQPMRNLQAIRHAAAPGLQVSVELQGDTFEMEDQRNWTDASFKTYCTPLDDPFPVEVRAGDVIEQAVVIHVKTSAGPGGAGRQAAETQPPAVSFTVVNDERTALPEIGLQGSLEALSEADAALLRQLGPRHLRFDVLAGANLQGDLEAAVQQAESVGARIELALFIDDASQSLDGLADFPNVIRRVLLFDDRGGTPGAERAQATRWQLQTALPTTLVGSGTNRYFAEFNRNRPQSSDWDFLCWSINPQVHAFDNLSLVETLSMQQVTVASAKAFVDQPVSISPVTLRPRFNPDACVFAADQIRRTDPDAIDNRQPTLFAAGWTLGSLKSLAEANVASVTYFEPTGPRGIMPAASEPCTNVFPAYHVLADVLEYEGGHVTAVQSSDQLSASAMLLEHNGKRRLIVANHRAEPVVAELPPAGGSWKMRSLDEHSLHGASTDPTSFRQHRASVETGTLRHELPPHAVVTFDLDGAIDG